MPTMRVYSTKAYAALLLQKEGVNKGMFLRRCYCRTNLGALASSLLASSQAQMHVPWICVDY